MEYLGRAFQEEETESTKALSWRSKKPTQAHHEIHHGWTERMEALLGDEP